MRGEMNAEDCVHFLAKASGIEANELFVGLIESCKAMTFITPKLPVLVSELKATGMQVVIATDNMDTFPRWTVPALGLRQLFDGILDSHTLRCLKRDKGGGGESIFFADYLAQHNLAPEECLLVDDSADTVAAVKSFGIDVMRVERGVGVEAALTTLL